MKITAAGIAVIEDDTLLSQWIEQEGRLDIARERALVDAVKAFIPVGGVVCDIGASLGAHTAIYAELVGATGQVYAFEPNPPAFVCLAHNMAHRPNVTVVNVALGAVPGMAGLVPDRHQPKNYGMYALTAGSDVRVTTLDQALPDLPRLDFIKLDVEGSELDVLQGAAENIAKFHPAILMEVHVEALKRHGVQRDDLYRFLDRFGYGFFPVTGSLPSLDARIAEPEIDVVCAPFTRFAGTPYLRCPTVEALAQ